MDPTGTIKTKIVGVTFSNPGGKSRQKLLKRCKKGDALLLIREPKNRYDRNAIKVCTQSHKQLGYISRELAEDMAPLMDEGNRASAQILNVTGESTLGCNLGCNIEITWQEGIAFGDIWYLVKVGAVLFVIVWLFFKICK